MEPEPDAAAQGEGVWGGGVGAAAELPDIVVPVREGAYNEYLRYALRSWAANVQHRNVWVVGFRPWWVAGVQHIETYQRNSPGYVNTTKAMRAACEHPEVSDPFLWCNDDFFVMHPQPSPFPVHHRGPVRELEAHLKTRPSAYFAEMRRTRDFLVGMGHEDPICYELHVPRVVHKPGMLKALDVAPGHDAHKLTVFYNLAELGGTPMTDVKIARRGPQFDTGSPFLSTMPDAFTNGHVGRWIRSSFPEPCTYEKRGH